MFWHKLLRRFLPARKVDFAAVFEQTERNHLDRTFRLMRARQEAREKGIRPGDPAYPMFSDIK